jgi:uncharacterized protein HemX
LSQSIQTSTENQEKIALINSKLTDDQITDPDQISQNIKEGEKLYSNNPNSDLRKEINKALTKLFEIDPVKACQNIIAIIDEKLKEVQKLQLVLDQRTIFKIEQLKRGEIVDRDVIINNKDKIFQEIEDKINEKKTNLSVGSYSKKSSLLDIFLLLIFISLGAIVLITV